MKSNENRNPNKEQPQTETRYKGGGEGTSDPENKDGKVKPPNGIPNNVKPLKRK